jgi:hypothetical protein
VKKEGDRHKSFVKSVEQWRNLRMRRLLQLKMCLREKYAENDLRVYDREHLGGA